MDQGSVLSSAIDAVVIPRKAVNMFSLAREARDNFS